MPRTSWTGSSPSSRRVDLDHTEHLGKTVSRIAREKAAIVKPTSRAVTVAQEALPVIEARCREVHAPWRWSSRRPGGTTGGRPPRSRGASSRVVRRDRCSDAASGNLPGGERRARGHGPLRNFEERDSRFRTRRFGPALRRPAGPPGWIWFVRHPRPRRWGPQPARGGGARASMRELFPGRKVLLVVGILNDKDLSGMAAALGPLASRTYACRPKTHRAFDGEAVAVAFRPPCRERIHPVVRDAIDTAIAAASPTISS